MNNASKQGRIRKLLTLVLSCGLSFSSFQAVSEDIDIFSVDVSDTVNKPNVLIVLDNSANWSRQAQQWPGGLQQGQSEVRAITKVINELDNGSVNVGLLTYITGGNSSDTDSGMIRYHIRPMDATNKLNLSNILYGPDASGPEVSTSIFANINDPSEKRSQGNPFGNLMWDVYNYLGEFNASQLGAGTIDAKSDDAGYTVKHSQFRSPLASTDSCNRTVVIFIGNNVSAGPTGDSTANQNALVALTGAPVSQIPFANYNMTRQSRTISAGYDSTACWENQADCTNAERNTAACLDGGFESCSCSVAGASCTTTAKFTIEGNEIITTPVSSTTDGPTPNVATGEATVCPNSNSSNPNPYSCPGTTTSTVAGPGPNQTTTTTTSWTNCAYVAQANACGNVNNPNKNLWTPRGTRTQTIVVNETAPSATFTDVPSAPPSSCRLNETQCTSLDFPAACAANGTYANCRCKAGSGVTGACGVPGNRWSVLGTFQATIEAIANGTFSPAPTASNSLYMADEWARFLRERGVPVPGGNGAKAYITTYTLDVFNAQQDAQFSALLFNMARVGGGKYFQARNENAIVERLRQIFSEVQAVNSAFSSASLPVNATNRAQNENQVFIGVFRPDRTKRPVWFGNLKRYQVVQAGAAVGLGDKNGNLAINPLTGFLSDCAVSYWTTASGNYWLNTITDDPAAVGNCGNVANSAHSDSPDGPFVEKGAVAEVLRKGNDASATADGDGNFAVNRLVKTRTAATAANSTLPNFTFPESTLTNIDRDGDGDVDGADATLKTARAALVENFIKGQDRFDDDLDSDTSTTGLTEPRSTIHGDVIHSRPQPVNYGDPHGDTDGDGDPDNEPDSPGVVIYYGANDGTYRAVRAETGQELWSFVAPEHFSKLDRLTANDPNIRYFDDDPTDSSIQRKDYFFDGSTGVFQAENNSDIWIFPTMRRGGRKLYAFDVTDTTAPMQPRFLWAKGCDASGCDDDDADPSTTSPFEDMGQTWSIPAAAKIAGYSSGTKPVVVVGGGYDECEDTALPLADNYPADPCPADPLGNGVYVLDAEDGTLLKHFSFTSFPGSRSVAADVKLVDVNNDQKADYGYVGDTGGSVYRLNFINSSGTALAPAAWTATRIARTTGAGRKFLFTPALFQASTKVMYVAIGSGDREAPLIDHYPYDDANGDGASDGGVVNRFYVFKDDLTGTTSEINLDTVSSTGMQDYSIEVEGCPDNPPVNGTCPEPIIPREPTAAAGDDYDTHAKGWFISMNANGQGEQVVTSAVIVAGFVIFSTNRPTATSDVICANSLGEARGYVMNLFDATGEIGPTNDTDKERSSVFTGGGLPPSPVVAVIPLGGRPVTIVIGAVQMDGSTSSYLDAQLPPIDVRPTRRPVYWFKTGDTDQN